MDLHHWRLRRITLGEPRCRVACGCDYNPHTLTSCARWRTAITDASPDKADQALAEGKLWRAREILGGRVASGPFDPHLYERLGTVLLRMGDDIEAGKYLFLSGVRTTEYASAIALFLQRHSRSGWRSLVATFPTRVRRARWADLPAEVRTELQAAGVPVKDAGTVSPALDRHAREASGFGGCAVAVLGGIGVVMLLAYALAYFGVVGPR